ILFEQVAGAALLGGNVDQLVLAVARLCVGKLNQHHFGLAEMVAYGNDQNAFTNLFGIGHGRERLRMLGEAPQQESSKNDHSQGASGTQTARFQPQLPPRGAFLWKLRRQSLPHSKFIVLAWVGDREVIQSAQKSFDAFKLPAARATILEVREDFVAAGG